MLVRLIALLSIFYLNKVKEGNALIRCDSDLMVNRSKQLKKSQPVNFSNDDLRRSIPKVKQRITTNFEVTLD